MSNPLYKISYGLYAICTNFYGKDNSCIVNTVQMVTETPTRISVAINKNNFTHDVVLQTGEFNVSVLTKNAPFELFQKLGMQSGKEIDKLDGISYVKRSPNEIVYLTQYSNAVISAKVVSTVDLGTHTLFIADVTYSESINDDESATYAYYHSNIKPGINESKGYVCTICGYVHKDGNLPEDFLCPLCNHGAQYFEKIK